MRKVKIFVRNLLIIMGLLFTLMILMALTSAPFWIWYNLGVKKAGIHRPPDFIVVMGGGGMPSESGLMRCWYAAKVANHFTRARVIIALPGDVKDSLSSVNQMKKEMELRGISPERIMFEDSGTNTRAEALNVFKIISDIERNQKSSFVTRYSSLLIVTSPEHLYRAVLAFKKAGFLKVDGVPAFEKTIEADLSFNARKLGARAWVPDVGKNITIRYQFWVHIEYEFLVLREYIALAYYKMQGWI
ncbi:MAG: YdcF family protein [Bacteroidota bacterium]